MERMNRRKFMKTSGKITLAGASALSIESLLSRLVRGHLEVAYASDSQAGFDVYNGINPDTKEIVAYTFEDCISKGLAPGICYKTSKPIIAVAKGTVTEVAEWEARSSFLKNLGDDPMEAKGYFVKVTHGTNFISHSCHLKKPEVKFGQKINRGERLGHPDERWNLPRLLLTTEHGTASDPDNFGINHGFMTYWDGVTDLDKSKEEQNKKLQTQYEILNKIAGMAEGPEKYTLLSKKHKGKDQVYKWVPIEKFRYIENLYQNKPKTFLSLTKEKFAEIKKEFYINQPIILTLPFKKG